MSVQTDDLRHRFTYHPPVGTQAARYAEIRAKALELALLIRTSCPAGRAQDLAFTAAEEACVWAEAAIEYGENDQVGPA